jgi:phosphoribosylamine-glycine ligase
MNPPESTVKTWVLLTQGWDGFPVAHHLQQEGKNVVVGQVQDKAELKTGDKEEKPDEKESRLAQYDGILKKYPASRLVKALKKVKNKDDYFIYCDQNSLFAYSEELLKAGFTKGNFPTKADFDFEKGREEAMDFVEKYYPEVQIIPHQKVKTADEAREIVENSDVPLVIQSEGDFVSTIVGPDDVEQSKQTILAALDKHEKEYAKGEIILKEKLVKPVEITPQIIFWNGEPVFTDLDIETKNIGDGENNGNQVGCGSNLIVRTDLNDEINRIAFPDKVYEMAKEHTGIFIWDISLYITDDGIFFGEFCSNRFGYDALFTEMTMAHGPSEFFEKIMAKQNPLEHFKYGTAVRVFNLNRAEDQEIIMGKWKPAWMFEMQAKDGKNVSIDGCWDLGVITGRGNSVREAIENVYNNYDSLVFKEKYARSKEDFLGDYPTSIMRRFNETNDIYYA